MDNGALEPESIVINAPDQPQVTLSNYGLGLEIAVGNFFSNSNSLTPQDGIKSWSAWDTITGKLLCNKISTISCIPSKQTVGTNYKAKVIVTNESGSSEPGFSDTFANCSQTSTILISKNKKNPISGSEVTLSGRGYLCTGQSPKFSYREWKNGSSGWSKWYSLQSSKDQRFSIKKKYLTPTDLEFRATAAGETVASTEERVSVIPGSTLFRVSKKSSYTKQGFTQGGALTISLSTGLGYQGTCEILASNLDATNFAGTPMGQELKNGSIVLKKGKGSGTLKMRWNGVVSVQIYCTSPVFPFHDYESVKNISLRSNF
jgi:hypothetical protein